jgi:hypothetical protein
MLPALVLGAAVAVALPLALTASGPRPANAAQASRAAAAAPAADSPAGFYYGTDSWPIAITAQRRTPGTPMRRRKPRRQLRPWPRPGP